MFFLLFQCFIATFPCTSFPFELHNSTANNPSLGHALTQLAPFLLTVFISILPYLLLIFVKFEKPIEKVSMQHPSLFSKLAAFTIIQTFFVSTFSGSLISSLEKITESPEMMFGLIAKGLINQSAFFIQLIIVQNLLSLGIELLRVSPVSQEWVGSLIKTLAGYDLTEKEENMSYLGIRGEDITEANCV